DDVVQSTDRRAGHHRGDKHGWLVWLQVHSYSAAASASLAMTGCAEDSETVRSPGQQCAVHRRRQLAYDDTRPRPLGERRVVDNCIRGDRTGGRRLKHLAVGKDGTRPERVSTLLLPHALPIPAVAVA